MFLWGILVAQQTTAPGILLKGILTICQDGCIETLMHAVHERLHLLLIDSLVTIPRQIHSISCELLGLPVFARCKGNLGQSQVEPGSSCKVETQSMHAMITHQSSNYCFIYWFVG